MIISILNINRVQCTMYMFMHTTECRMNDHRVYVLMLNCSCYTYAQYTNNNINGYEIKASHLFQCKTKEKRTIGKLARSVKRIVNNEYEFNQLKIQEE